MKEQFDFFTRSVDLFRSMSSALLSSSEELVATQLDSTQAYVSHGTNQLRMAMSEACALQGTEPSALVEAGLRNSIEMTCNAVLANSQCQVETLRLLQLQAAETQQRLRDSFSESWRAMQVVGSAAVSISNSSDAAQKQAA